MIDDKLTFITMCGALLFRTEMDIAVGRRKPRGTPGQKADGPAENQRPFGNQLTG
jgi:hypothetical protein